MNYGDSAVEAKELFCCKDQMLPRAAMCLFIVPNLSPSGIETNYKNVITNSLQSKLKLFYHCINIYPCLVLFMLSMLSM